MPLFASFDFRSFHGIRLQEAMKLGGFSPAAAVIIVFHTSRCRIHNDRVSPIRKLDREARFGAGKEFNSSLNWLGQSQPAAGGGNGGRIANLSFDFDDVTDCLGSLFNEVSID